MAHETVCVGGVADGACVRWARLLVVEAPPLARCDTRCSGRIRSRVLRAVPSVQIGAQLHKRACSGTTQRTARQVQLADHRSCRRRPLRPAQHRNSDGDRRAFRQRRSITRICTSNSTKSIKGRPSHAVTQQHSMRCSPTEVPATRSKSTGCPKVKRSDGLQGRSGRHTEQDV